MQVKGDLIRAVIEMCHAKNAAAAADSRAQLERLLAVDIVDITATHLDPHPTVRRILADRPAPIRQMSDKLLSDFNAMLPWGAISSDLNGRVIGSSWTSAKRCVQSALIDPRLEMLDAHYPIRGKHVLEVGCFEGLHTIGCLAFGATVTAIDSRMENLLKTVSRLWLYGFVADVQPWDLEDAAVPAAIPEGWDMLHHIGVLYHQTNPAESLALLAARTRETILLDTHVASNRVEATNHYSALGRTFHYVRRGEASTSPFAGTRDHAKWLLVEDIEWICEQAGFKIAKSEVRQERNGARALIWAMR